MTIAAIDVRDLAGHPGASRHQAVEGTLEDAPASEVASVLATQPLEAELLLESIVEGVLVSGSLKGAFHLVCSRCLKEFDQPFELQLSELFSPEPEEDSDDYPLDEEGFIDVEQMVRDAVGLELPFSPLCKPDCLGLCPVCGGDMNAGECSGQHEQIDPRWSGLEEVLGRLNEASE